MSGSFGMNWDVRFIKDHNYLYFFTDDIKRLHYKR